ncbi:BTB/POZ domain-containing protein 6-like [Mizuhopecten yessoensis]|uniref:BTB/POZ domain-containing protein 6 n=1 Tax=Mizuhopecten yessoensis TaxID=6573 RepID=A0A210PXS0_MIZYE|nr:BTB/POZ domain-containing protein 6-like [Mizuhopecten yessoensis]OWF41276.1 BTB/POZ domain-containing protein 6 [Mizuhopecten yessoensis]
MASSHDQSPERDWQVGKSLNHCLDYLFTSGLACDVTFLIGDEKEKISAHRTILLSRSPVFYAMFEGNLAEKESIIIPDYTARTFSMFLRYLYTDEIQLTVETVTSVLSVARKYIVDNLVTKCETFLKDSLTTENVCLLLEEAHVYTEESLKEDCVHVITRSPEGALKSTSFVDLCGVCVKSITESDDLAVEESVVYEAMMRWSEAECGRQGLEVTDTNRREVLGDIIYTVRFPIMEHAYFRKKVLVTDILSSMESRDIMRYHEDSKGFPCKEFNKNFRRKKRVEYDFDEDYNY